MLIPRFSKAGFVTSRISQCRFKVGVGPCGWKCFWGGGSKNLMQAKSEEGYVMIKVHPEGGT